MSKRILKEILLVLLMLLMLEARFWKRRRKMRGLGRRGLKEERLVKRRKGGLLEEELRMKTHLTSCDKKMHLIYCDIVFSLI